MQTLNFYIIYDEYTTSECAASLITFTQRRKQTQVQLRQMVSVSSAV